MDNPDVPYITGMMDTWYKLATQRKPRASDYVDAYVAVEGAVNHGIDESYIGYIGIVIADAIRRGQRNIAIADEFSERE